MDSAKLVTHMSTFNITFQRQEFFNVKQKHMEELDVPNPVAFILFKNFSQVCMYTVYPVKNNKIENRLAKYGHGFRATSEAFIVIQTARKKTERHSKPSAEATSTLLRAEIACLINTVT